MPGFPGGMVPGQLVFPLAQGTAALTSQDAVEVLAQSPAAARATQDVVEVLTPATLGQVTQDVVEILAQAPSAALVTQDVVELLTPASETRVSQDAIEVLSPASETRATQLAVEVLAESRVEARATQDAVEILTPATPASVTEDVVEILSPASATRATQLAVEILAQQLTFAALTQDITEVLSPAVDARVTELVLEVLSPPVTQARLTQDGVETLTPATPGVVTQAIVELLSQEFVEGDVTQLVAELLTPASEARATQAVTELLTLTTEAWATQDVLEVLALTPVSPDVSARATQLVTELLAQTQIDLRLTQLAIELLSPTTEARLTQLVAELLTPATLAAVTVDLLELLTPATPAILSQAPVEVLAESLTFARATQDVVETLTQSPLTTTVVRTTADLVETLTQAPSAAGRTTQAVVELLAQTPPVTGRTSQDSVEVLAKTPPILGGVTQVALEVFVPVGIRTAVTQLALELYRGGEFPAVVTQTLLEVWLVMAACIDGSLLIDNAGAGSACDADIPIDDPTTSVEARLTHTLVEILTALPPASAQVSQAIVEILAAAEARVHATQDALETLSGATTTRATTTLVEVLATSLRTIVQTSQDVLEVLLGSTTARATQAALEVLIPATRARTTHVPLEVLAQAPAPSAVARVAQATPEVLAVASPLRYVSIGGSNIVTCSQAMNIGTPKRTITDALSCLLPGDTLYVRGGTYDEALLDAFPSGTATDRIRLAAYPGETVWLKPTSGNWVIHTTGSPSYVEIEGINLDGTLVGDATVFLDDREFGLAHHLRFSNLEVRSRDDREGGNTNAAVVMGGHHHVCQQLVVHGIGGPYGFYVHGHDHLIEGCDIFGTASAFIQVYHNASLPGYVAPPTDNIIRGNRCHDLTEANFFGVDDGRTWGIIIYNAIGTQVINNTFTRVKWVPPDPMPDPPIENQGGVIAVLGEGTRIWHNTIYDCFVTGISIDGLSTDTLVQNNISYLAGADFEGRRDLVRLLSDRLGPARMNQGARVVTQDHNLFGIDPLFVNAGADDFRLQTGSPARNAGTTVVEVTRDFDRVPRPAGPAYDIGAYEQV